MRFIRFIVFFLLINSVIVFCVLLNLKLAFGSPKQAKKIISKSNAYEVVVASIRDNIVLANSDFDKGTMLEVLNEQIDSSKLQIITEDLVDQFYAAAESPSGKSEVILRYSMLASQLPAEITLPADQTYSLENKAFPVFPFMRNFTMYMGGHLILIVLLLALHFWLIGKTKKQKLKWFGISFLLIAFVLASIVTMLYFVIPQIIGQLSSSLELESQKIIRGFTKVADLILVEQKLYYIIELSAAALVTFVSFAISKAIRENPTSIDYRG